MGVSDSDVISCVVSKNWLQLNKLVHHVSLWSDEQLMSECHKQNFTLACPRRGTKRNSSLKMNPEPYRTTVENKMVACSTSVVTSEEISYVCLSLLTILVFKTFCGYNAILTRYWLYLLIPYHKTSKHGGCANFCSLERQRTPHQLSWDAVQ